MSTETAEPAIPVAAEPAKVRGPRFIRALRADPLRMRAIRDTWRALWLSRLLVWGAGVGTVLAFGFGPARKVFNPPGMTHGFGWLGDLLAAPAARWDSVWYLVIAHFGYRPDLGSFTSSRTAFFPLYPLGLKVISWVGVQPVIAGVAISCVALALALYGIHRLSTLELAQHAGSDVARLTVMLTAFAPMAFFLSAVYSEALYLALSVGAFWCARNGRWARAGILAALAAATRSAGLVLALPLLMLYLYGPREDREADFPERSWWLPRYRIRRDLAWLSLLPVGVGIYMAYLALKGGYALEPFQAQEIWHRHFAGPFLGVWDGARAAFQSVEQLLSTQSHHLYISGAINSPSIAAIHDLMLFAFLLAALPAIVGVLRALPLAYGAYVLSALAMPLSYPVSSQPLMSLPRFLLVLFPLNMWLAAWLCTHPRARRPVLVLSAVMMVGFLGQFATWHWVA